MYEVRPIQKNVLIKDYNIIIRSLRSKLYFSLFCLFVCVQSLCICIKPMENHNFKIQLGELRTQYYAYSKTFTCSTNLPKIGPKVRVVFLQGALKVRIKKKKFIDFQLIIANQVQFFFYFKLHIIFKVISV